MIHPVALVSEDSLDGFTAASAEVDQTQVQCGLTCCNRILSSQCLQKFATVKTFFITLLILCLLQGSSQGYLSTTASVTAKRFDLPDSFIDWFLLGSELTQGILALAIAFLGGRGHRPSWVGAFALFQTVSCLFIAVPQITEGARRQLQNGSESEQQREWLCSVSSRSTVLPTTKPSWIVMISMIVFQVAAGLGMTSFMAHGLTYLDDNTEKIDSPSLLGALLAVRHVGLKFGEILAYEISALSGARIGNLVSGEQLNSVWWLGWPILAVLLLATGFSIALFPHQLPSKAVKEAAEFMLDFTAGHVQISEKREYIIDLPPPGFGSTLLRLLRNRMVIFNILSMICMHIALVNFYSLENRYLLSVYHIPKTENTGGVFRDQWISRVTSGFLKPFIVGMILLLSGLLISRKKPRSSILAAWNCLIIVIAAIIFFTNISLGCPQLSVSGYHNGRLNLRISCNSMCSCLKMTPFMPVCDRNGFTTYFSPCHAGCKSMELIDNLKLYHNCSCIPYGQQGRGGPCTQRTCSGNWVMFQSLGVLISALLATGTVGNLLLCLRCVALQDKSALLGLELMLVGLMHIPGKVAYKAVTDSTCKHWGENLYTCEFFESQSLVLYFNTLTGGLMLLSAIFACFVWFYAQGLCLYTEEKLKISEELELDEIQKQKIRKRLATPAVCRRKKTHMSETNGETERLAVDNSHAVEEIERTLKQNQANEGEAMTNALIIHRIGTLV